MSSPGKKWSSRFGAAVRRSSSILSVSRPTTPSADADRSSLLGSDRESLKGDRDSANKVDAISRLVTPAVPVTSHPSPIAESPAREAAATSEEPLGPSPLARGSGVVTAGASSSEVNLPLTTAIVPPAAPEETVVSPSGYVPPPVIDSTAGNPGAFTDDPDSLPPTGPVPDPYAPSIRAASRAPSILENPHPVQEEPAPAPAPAPEPEPEVQKVEDAPVVLIVDEPQPMPTSIPTAPNTPPAPVVRSLTPEPAPVDTALEDAASQERSRDFAETAHHNTSLGLNAAAATSSSTPPAAPPSIPDMDHGEAAEFYQGGPASKAPSKAPSIANIPVSKAKEKEKEVVIVPDWADPASPSSRRDPEHSYSLPAYSSSGQEVWGGKPLGQDPVVVQDDPFRGGMPVPEPNGHSNGHAHDDPFADHNKMHVPEPIVGIREETNGGIMVPLPPLEDVIPSSTSMHGMPDEGTYAFRAPTRASDPENDERLPLLSKPQTNYGGGPSSGHTHSNIYISPVDPSSNGGPTQWRPVSSSDPHPTSHLRLHELGWLEYHLPDGTVYYVHPTRRVTTECNLRSERILDQLCAFLDEKGLGDLGGRGKSQGSGVEVWCRDLSAAAASASGSGSWSGSKKSKKVGFVGALYWVDHNARSIVPDAYGFSPGALPVSGRGKKGKGVNANGAVVLDDEDQLDCEYRYWSFVEAHPAHNPLQPKAKAEALDVLNWAWTDRLLPSSNAVPPPFAQEECQELMALLRSFSADQVQNENGIQNRIVARILIRVAQWRQAYFRPNKSLPTDVPSASSASTGGPYSPYGVPQRRTARRAVMDLLISCVCLGIPYIFLERTRGLASGGLRVDEEGGLRAAASSPFIVVGACTCLVAAIVLSASVTFLSLPGLDDASRVAGIVAIALATLSLVTTVVAVFKYKSDMGRTVGHVGAHGLVLITRRSVILALPTVFLVYAIIGFVTGIVLYSVRGHAALVGGVESAHQRVQEGVSVAETVLGATQVSSSSSSARWPIVGVVGAIGGLFATSAVLMRR